MTIKNLLMLGGVLAGAAYLQNKSRRDRVFGQARGALDKWKVRAQELAQQVETKAHSFANPDSMSSTAGATTRRDNGVGTSTGGIGSGYGGSGIGGGSGYSR